MTLDEKKIKASELRELYHNNIVLDNFFTRNPKYYAPTNIPELNWMWHIYISLSLLSDISGIYYEMTDGGAIFIDIYNFIVKSTIKIFDIIF